MNYLLQIKAFYDWLVTNPIPADAQALWHALMYINNKCGWTEWFTVSNTTLISMLNISRSQLHKMREILIKKGLVSYKKEQGRKAGKYCITKLVSIIYTQPETQVETQLETQDAHNWKHNWNTLNKLNKTKQNNINNIIPPASQKKQSKKPKKDKPPKIHYAEYVTMTEAEYQSLVNRFGETDAQRMIEILNNYKGAVGKEYKSDYLAILNWVVKRLQEEKAKSLTNNHEPTKPQLDLIHFEPWQLEAQRKRREKLAKRSTRDSV